MQVVDKRPEDEPRKGMTTRCDTPGHVLSATAFIVVVIFFLHALGVLG